MYGSCWVLSVKAVRQPGESLFTLSESMKKTVRSLGDAKVTGEQITLAKSFYKAYWEDLFSRPGVLADALASRFGQGGLEVFLGEKEPEVAPDSLGKTFKKHLGGAFPVEIWMTD